MRSLPESEQQEEGLEEANDSTTKLMPDTAIAASADSHDSEEIAPSSLCNMKDPCLGAKTADVLRGPFQPTADSVIGGTFPKRQFGKQQRCFQSSWYDKFVWLEYSPQLDAAFCFSCRFAECSASGTIGRPDPSFTRKGFRNWKTALDDFRKHELSSVHSLASGMWHQARHVAATGSSVAQSLSDDYARRVELNRRNLSKIIHTILFLGRQNIPFRGRHESEGSLNKGNFLELLNLRALDNPDLALHLKGTFTYTSPKIQNEIIALCGRRIQRGIVEEVRKSGCYGLICDETTDISRQEQLSICLRYVDETVTVHERFLGFWPVKETDGESLHNFLKDVLKELGIPVCMMRAQCYDGAANMRGRYKGVSTRFLQDESRAIYIHCHAHVLNLTLAKASTSVQDVRNILGVVDSLYKLLEGSAKRHMRFKNIQESVDSENPATTLKRICETRWSSRYQAVKAIKVAFKSIVQTLQTIASDDAELGADAVSLQKSVETFQFYFYISVLEATLGKTAVLSEFLQAKHVELFGVKAKVLGTIEALNCVRGDFEMIWKQTEKLAEELDLEMPRLARKRKASERLEWGRSEPYYPATPKDQFRMTVNELVDTMIMELRERFNENNYDVLTAVETLLADALTETKPNLSLLQTACQFYRSDFDYSRLHHQLTVFYGEIKAIASSHGKRQIESDLPAIQHIRQLFAGKGLRDSYPEVLRLLQIYLVVPVSSAESERSFSTLRRLKTWLRSSMEEERLAALALLTVEREEVLKLEEAIDELIEEFCARGNRRMIFQ